MLIQMTVLAVLVWFVVACLWLMRPRRPRLFGARYQYGQWWPGMWVEPWNSMREGFTIKAILWREFEPITHVFPTVIVPE